MSVVAERRPLPVSTIEIVFGVILYVKSACVVGFCTVLKSRLIDWCGDIGQCTQMNTGTRAGNSTGQPRNPKVGTAREGQPKTVTRSVADPVSSPVPLLFSRHGGYCDPVKPSRFALAKSACALSFFPCA